MTNAYNTPDNKDNQENKSVHQGAMTISRSIDEAYGIACRDGFALLDTDIDVARLSAMLDDDGCGALASFEGRVRNHNNDTSVERLTYYGYEALALNQGRQIMATAMDKFDISRAVAIHRIGALEIGDIAVWIGVGAAHRYPAFDACRWILDTIKADIPVWKQEFYEAQSSKWLSNNG